MNEKETRELLECFRETLLDIARNKDWTGADCIQIAIDTLGLDKEIYFCDGCEDPILVSETVTHPDYEEGYCENCAGEATAAAEIRASDEQDYREVKGY